MIKTIVSKPVREPKSLKYHTSFPVLGIYPKVGRIVLFTKCGQGIVMCTGTDSTHEVGHSSDNWLMVYYVEYKGSVTISNS